MNAWLALGRPTTQNGPAGRLPEPGAPSGPTKREIIIKSSRHAMMKTKLIGYNVISGLSLLLSLVILLLMLLVHYGFAHRESNRHDLSSTLLRLHRLYLQQPPHDTCLYDSLQVSPNATVADITKSYRKLSRLLHPDKQISRSNYDADATKLHHEIKLQLQRVRQAYDVLKDDSTRLPYHRYGLIDTKQAVILLTGQSLKRKQPALLAMDDPAMKELMTLMGYASGDDDDDFTSESPSSSFLHSKGRSSGSFDHHRRVWIVAVKLLETIRPLVEDTVDERILAHEIASQCDRLKGLPLGAHILRCIGRAYRHAGRSVLLRAHQEQKQTILSGSRSRLGQHQHALTELVRERFRDAKHLLTACVATGRVVLSEQLYNVPVDLNRRNLLRAIAYYNEGAHGENDQAEEEMKIHDRTKAKRVLLDSLHVEALWKITKIDLDRIILEACDLILSGNFFFLPSHQSLNPTDWKSVPEGNPDTSYGWVGARDFAVEAEVGKLRAAAALVMIGDIMVQRSKEGTAWME